MRPLGHHSAVEGLTDFEDGAGLPLGQEALIVSGLGVIPAPLTLPELGWGGCVGGRGLDRDSLLPPPSVHLQLHGVGTCVWLPRGQVQSEVSHVRGHCLLVPGDTGVVLHPQRGEAPRWLLLPPTLPHHCRLGLGNFAVSLVQPHYTPCLPELICPPVCPLPLFPKSSPLPLFMDPFHSIPKHSCFFSAMD